MFEKQDVRIKSKGGRKRQQKNKDSNTIGLGGLHDSPKKLKMEKPVNESATDATDSEKDSLESPTSSESSGDASDSESESEESTNEGKEYKEEESATQKQNFARKPPTRPCLYFRKGNCKHGTQCTFSHILQAPSSSKRHQQSSESGIGKRRNLRSLLMEAQKRRERNLLVQCVRWILQNPDRFEGVDRANL
jgi:hypothetical protein